MSLLCQSAVCGDNALPLTTTDQYSFSTVLFSLILLNSCLSIPAPPFAPLFRHSQRITSSTFNSSRRSPVLRCHFLQSDIFIVSYLTFSFFFSLFVCSCYFHRLHNFYCFTTQVDQNFYYLLNVVSFSFFVCICYLLFSHVPRPLCQILTLSSLLFSFIFVSHQVPFLPSLSFFLSLSLPSPVQLFFFFVFFYPHTEMLPITTMSSIFTQCQTYFSKV